MARFSRSLKPAGIAVALLLCPLIVGAPVACLAAGARPDVASLPVSVDATREQVVLGDRIFHGEAANGKCHECHGWDAKGTGNGNDLTVGSLIWGDSLSMIKRTLRHNIEIAPGRDGDLTDSDVEAAAAYVWALVHQDRFR